MNIERKFNWRNIVMGLHIHLEALVPNIIQWGCTILIIAIASIGNKGPRISSSLPIVIDEGLKDERVGNRWNQGLKNGEENDLYQ